MLNNSNSKQNNNKTAQDNNNKLLCLIIKNIIIGNVVIKIICDNLVLALKQILIEIFLII